MAYLKRAIRFLHYYLTAQTKHDVHPPFVFEFVTKVLNDNRLSGETQKIEIIRQKLLADDSEINVTDYGTAFGGPRFYKRKISAIAKHSAKTIKYAQLLYRIVAFYKPATILELGTSFGISTAYLASGNNNARIVTIEGCPETAGVAEKTFSSIGSKNIEMVKGNFDETLERALAAQNSFDLIFFDGNHRKAPTLKYFEKCLAKKNDESIFIFDDISWSGEMRAAWDAIKQNENVKTTVDLFQMGIVFINPDLSKQHFTIRF